MNFSTDDLRHAEKAEIIGVASVNGTAVTEFTGKEQFTVDKIHIVIAVFLGDPIGFINGGTAGNGISVTAEVRLGYEYHGRVRIGIPEGFIQRIVGFLQMFQSGCVMVIVTYEYGNIQRCNIGAHGFFCSGGTGETKIDEIGIVFAEVLECAGVYKQTEEGLSAFRRFIASL